MMGLSGCTLHCRSRKIYTLLILQLGDKDLYGPRNSTSPGGGFQIYASILWPVWWENLDVFSTMPGQWSMLAVLWSFIMQWNSLREPSCHLVPNQEALYKDPTEGWISLFGYDFCSLPFTLPCMWQGDGLLGLLWSCSVSRGQQPPGSQQSELLGLQLCQHYCVSPAALQRSPPGHWAAGTGSSGVWVGVHTHELDLGCPHMGLLPSGLSWNQQLGETWAKSAVGHVVLRPQVLCLLKY